MSNDGTPPGELNPPGQIPARFDAIDAAAHQPLPVDELGKREQRKFESEMRSEIHRLVIYSLRFGALILGSLMVVRFWHLAAPDTLRWLSDSEVQSMDKMLFSSAFGGFVFSYLRDAVANRHK